MSGTPRVESTEIVAQINMLIEMLNHRGHGIRDYENKECILERVEYDDIADEFYCYFG